MFNLLLPFESTLSKLTNEKIFSSLTSIFGEKKKMATINVSQSCKKSRDSHFSQKASKIFIKQNAGRKKERSEPHLSALNSISVISLGSDEVAEGCRLYQRGL